MSSRSKQLSMLRQVMKAKHAQRLSAFQTVVARETRIRQQIEELRGSARDARQGSTADMKTIGADLAWQSWVEQQITRMNMELAQILVQKEFELKLLRAAFGKKNAGDEIAKREAHLFSAEQKKKAEIDRLENVLHDAIRGKKFKF